MDHSYSVSGTSSPIHGRRGTIVAIRILLILFFCITLWGNPPKSAYTIPEKPAVGSSGETIQQFSAAGHVLGFRPSGAWIASGDHLLRIDFVGAEAIEPQSETQPAADRELQPLDRVVYRQLWPGISLVYESALDGVLKSSYLVDAGAEPNAIRLAYNRRPQIDASGALVFEFASGRMVESTPIAWQEVDGARVDVAVAYRQFPEGQIGFMLGDYDPRYDLTIDPVVHWNNFMGAASDDEVTGIVFSGNDQFVYITGKSDGPWVNAGTPKLPHSGGEDAFVAKLDPDGDLLWYTFLGCADDDTAFDISKDGAENLYVIGESAGTWGSNPVRAHQGGYDAFFAKLDSNGNLLWHTFLGGSGQDYGRSVDYHIANLVVTGFSGASWQNGATPPVRAFSGSYDAFVAKVNTASGAIEWNTFLGSSAADRGMGIAATTSYVFVTGYSYGSWGSPYRAYTALNDAFVAKLSISGGLSWNTFLGGAGNDYGRGIDLDSSANIYVVGYSSAAWQGSYPPTRAYSGSTDAWAAEISSIGILQWNTFLGSALADSGYDIVVASSSQIYVVGKSDASWASPVVPHAGGSDAFAARLDGGGALTWNTFRGSARDDIGYAIALSGVGLTAIGGESDAEWGLPLRANAGFDGFVSKNAASGAMDWHTFLGGASEDVGQAIELDADGNVFVTGYSQNAWGSSPKRAYHGKYDAFLVKLSPQGVRLWHTFLGGAEDDKAYGIAINSSGYIYVTGESQASWGSPVRAYSGAKDAFVAKVSNAGTLQWNTFLGSASNDIGYDVDLYSAGNFRVVGVSYATWGTSPRRAFSGGSDAFVAEIDDPGNLIWNTFLGGGGYDAARSVVIDNLANVYLTGHSSQTWGSPIRAHSGMGVYNAMVVKLNISGDYQWHTFLGGSWETAYGIARDNASNLYVTGMTYDGWGFPIRPCSTNFDAFVAKLAWNGVLLWNTCLGVNDSLTPDGGYGIATDSVGNSYVVGYSDGQWGSPSQPYSGDTDVFIAKVEASGVLAWNTFQGSSGADAGWGIALGTDESVYITGEAFGDFGSPASLTYGDDAFVVRLGKGYVYLPLVVRP